MATAAHCGYGGSLTGSAATEIKEWTCTLVVDAPEATSFASNGWKEFIPCLKGGSGNFKSNTPPSGGPQSLTLTAYGGMAISGSAIISNVEDTTPVDGIVTFSSDFVFTGTISTSLF